MLFLGWRGGIRTPECWDQNPVPYHLATRHRAKKQNPNILIIGIRVALSDPATSRLTTNRHRCGSAL